ncbi:hypothetical protein PIB30_008216 [Stylosanthes scabra]|uniref:Uncharacterized protein n=1 Tax=Stylosanthes scabra TaxID=79078 RepID=A0ABU6Q4S0_9FABA|nr:hypothetical protein [Stylosanthes scabra]
MSSLAALVWPVKVFGPSLSVFPKRLLLSRWACVFSLWMMTQLGSKSWRISFANANTMWTFNINGWEMMISLGFMAAASVRVVNELGRGNAKAANEHVARAVGDLSPLLSVYILLNSVQPVLSGVVVGAGWQSIVAYVNIGCYYLIGIPVGIVLGNVLDLQVKVVIARSKISKWAKLDGHDHESKSNSSKS